MRITSDESCRICEKIQVFIHYMGDSVAMCKLRFTSSKYKFSSKGWIDPKRSLVFAWDKLSEVGWFSYMDSCISPDGRVSDEMSSRIQCGRHLPVWNSRDVGAAFIYWSRPQFRYSHKVGSVARLIDMVVDSLRYVDVIAAWKLLFP